MHFDGNAAVFTENGATASFVSCAFLDNGMRYGVIGAEPSTLAVRLENSTFATVLHQDLSVAYPQGAACLDNLPAFYADIDLDVSDSCNGVDSTVPSQHLEALAPGSGMLTAEDPFLTGLQQVCLTSTTFQVMECLTPLPCNAGMLHCDSSCISGRSLLRFKTLLADSFAAVANAFCHSHSRIQRNVVRNLLLHPTRHAACRGWHALSVAHWHMHKHLHLCLLMFAVELAED
jgi:hypothetical protein